MIDMRLVKLGQVDLTPSISVAAIAKGKALRQPAVGLALQRARTMFHNDDFARSQ